MDSTEKAPELCAKELIEIIPLVMSFIRAEMRRQGAPLLSMPQLRVMIFLNRYPGCCLSDVADRLGVTRATASALVEKMVQSGLIQRAAHPQERRRHVLTLTELGRQQLEKVSSATCYSLAKELEKSPSPKLLKIREGLLLLQEIFDSP